MLRFKGWRKHGGPGGPLMAFPCCVPEKKWMQEKRNLVVGDLVLIKFDRSLGKDRYKLAKIKQVHPDQHGRVRTVTVDTQDRKKAVREKASICRAGLMEVKLPVQRLVVLVPSEEAWGEGLSVSSAA